MFQRAVYLDQSCFFATLRIITTGIRSACASLHISERFSRLFMIKITTNNFSVTSTHYSNGVKIGNFVLILINVKFYVFPMREILLAILSSYLFICFNLSPKMVDFRVSLTSNLS